MKYLGKEIRCRFADLKHLVRYDGEIKQNIIKILSYPDWLKRAMSQKENAIVDNWRKNLLEGEDLRETAQRRTEVEEYRNAVQRRRVDILIAGERDWSCGYFCWKLY